jgi:hypothetical protein
LLELVARSERSFYNISPHQKQLPYGGGHGGEARSQPYPIGNQT